jgi:release factor glutamine methyltransferase
LLADSEVDAAAAEYFRSCVARRRRGEPLQYIEGEVQFGPLDLLADRRALIPRPETEGLWEIAVAELTDVSNPVVLDLCTGSGNLALALKRAFPTATIFASDVSSDALALALENSQRLDLAVEFVRGDLFGAVPVQLRGGFDLVVSNPPYIGEGEFESLPDEVRGYEPVAALVAGPAGTEVLARIAAEVEEWLRPRGIVACEIGESQGEDCLNLFAHLDPRIEHDLTGRPRYILGRAPERSIVH